MKNSSLFPIAITAIAFTLLFTSCEKFEDEILTPSYIESELDNSAADARGSLVVGATSPAATSITLLTIDWWKYVLSFNCAKNPINTTSPLPGTTTPMAPVVFAVAPGHGAATRQITLSRNQSLLVPIINTLQTYPCGGDGLKPGESLVDYLTFNNSKIIDRAINLKVGLDSKSIPVTDKDRYVTDLFYFTGNRDLANCFDFCVTGKSQAGASDGYWVLLSGLSKGKHTLVVHAEVPEFDIVINVVYDIIVR